MNYELSEALARNFYKDIFIVTEFMTMKVKPLWESVGLASDRDVSIDGLYLRAIAWMQSLKKLNSGADIQPIVSGARSFLEITTDLILVYYDKTNESGWRMKWWGESAKLKSAKALIEYFKNRINETIPDAYESLVDFVTDNEIDIKRQRIALGWVDINDSSKDRHPERWTNRRSLLHDIIEADKLHGAIVLRHFGSNLERFYETEYRRLNWNVHGSGVTGIRGIDKEGINLIRAFGYGWNTKLAMVCTDIILRELKDRNISNDIDNIISEAEYISVNLVK